ncbi:MAG: hypothetical protein WED33_02860 [Bacteroidia bacterium]
MRKHLTLVILAIVLGFSSCKKCYECTCTNPDVLLGCSVEGEKIELCDKGLVGKSVLTARILDKEQEGYTCTVK